jgi:hypothetical protein
MSDPKKSQPKDSILWGWKNEKVPDSGFVVNGIDTTHFELFDCKSKEKASFVRPMSKTSAHFKGLSEIKEVLIELLAKRLVHDLYAVNGLLQSAGLGDGLIPSDILEIIKIAEDEEADEDYDKETHDLMSTLTIVEDNLNEDGETTDSPPDDVA